MKQIFKSLVLVAAAVATLTSCEKAPEVTPTPEEYTITVNANLPAPEGTKTYLGEFDSVNEEYPVLWSNNDVISLTQKPYFTADSETFESAGDKSKKESNSNPTLSADNTKATFEFPAFTDPEDNANFIDYIAVYGGTDLDLNNQRGASPHYFKVTVPATQAPAVGQFDPKAAIMGATVLGEMEASTNLSLDFDHLVAYAMLNVKGLNCGSEKVQSVTITSDEHKIAGAANWDYIGGTSFKPRGSAAAVKSITVNLSEQTLTTNDFEVYFTAIPTDFVAGDKLTFVVTTDAKTYTKNVDVASAFSLTQGKILDFSVNFAGVAADGSIQYDTYELVTNVADLAHNDEILIVAKNGEKYYAATTYGSNKVASIEVVVNADSIRIASTDESFNRFRLERDNGFYMFFSLKDNKYIRYASSGTDLATTDISDKTDETDEKKDYWKKGHWNISISDGLATIENVEVAGKFFKMNNEGYFKAYGTGKSYIFPSIYKKKVN